MAESKVVVPESVLKKRQREEEWALAKKQSAEAAKKTNAANRKLIYKRAEQYAKEYAEKVNFFCFSDMYRASFSLVLCK